MPLGIRDGVGLPVMLIDVHLPDMSGYQVAEHVRVVRPLTTTVLLSAAAQREGVVAKESLTSETLRDVVARARRARARATGLLEESTALRGQAELQLKRSRREPD
jgi:CheY-like chemotaxis protein